jgi:hypothetical protein
VATADSGETTLGFEALSLFVAIRTQHPGTNTTVWTLPEDEAGVEAWTTAAAAVTPFLEAWLGKRPRSPLTVLDLPDPEDAPFESGALLAAPIREGSQQAGPDQLDETLVRALTCAWMTPNPAASSRPARAWLTEGVATFMGTLWTEKQRGRDQALGALEAARPALALAEPASPGEGAGQPLTQAISPVYYRTKAAYVLGMLRQLAGDAALSAALSAYDPASEFSAQDTSKSLGKDAGPGPRSSSFQKLLEQTGSPASDRGSQGLGDRSSSPGWESGNSHDLAWFFADWVDADKGLPDLSIRGVFPTSTSAGNWLVAVTVANNGYASAEVPVTVRSDSTSVTERLLVPARGKAVQRILIQGKPTEAQVNDGTVPETQASVHVTTLGQAGENPASSSQPDHFR